MNRSPDNRDFRAFQADFAARIRDPRGQPRPQGVPARRMRVYENLLFNNLEGFLLACFPITRKILGVRAWRKTVRQFFTEYRCHSPLFRDIPGEFLAWMETSAEQLFPKRPYLYEFMHYEWVELSVSIHPDEIVASAIDPEGDLLDGKPILNPAAQLVCYHYPVHRIGPRFKPTNPDGQTYCYLVYRDAEDTVQFIVLNPVSARLLELIQTGCESGRAALMQIAQELSDRHPERIVELGMTLLQSLRHAGAVLGTGRML
ncbi:MAG: putative DNA-binding domain-containing protein [Gammaproteobacteria bacterium]|nr:putative DNA-binding domain-containing protein [Gammaproteobacteria bacterium]MBU2478070.1 putative DNA-binding domain-containing protein [Gammaproteobacteria bacterium]